MSKNISKLSARKGLEQNLFVAQQLAAKASDPIAAKQQLAKDFLIGPASIEASTSSYDFIQGENANKRAYVCNGTVCLCAGEQDKVRDKLVEAVGDEQVGVMTCLGHCFEAAAFQLDGANYSGDDIDNLESLLKQEKATKPMLQGASVGEPVLLAKMTSIEEWYQPLLSAFHSAAQSESDHQQVVDSLLNEVLAARVRGRGGAGFPAGLKWQAAREQQSATKYIVCNADEGDPGAFTDRYLLEHHPHTVLFGMLLAGFIVGAKQGVLYIRDEYPLSVDVCQQAIADLQELGFIGKNIQGTGIDFEFYIIRGAGAYICGEETALLRSIEGNKPIVSVRPPFPVVSGLFGEPTVLNNVETFAAMHWVIEHGGEAFASLGTEKSAGVKLVSLDHCFKQPGVYEVPMGMPLADIVDELGGGFNQPIKALHVGGPLGGLVPVSKINDLTLDFESFAEQGFLLGHASIIGVPESMPMLDYIGHLFEFTAHESCGKCFPCRLGATRGKEMVQAVGDGTLMQRELLDDLLETMQLGSLCALGGGVPLPIQNALQHFADELAPAFKPAEPTIKVKEVSA